MDESIVDIDQIVNLTKFCPTKDEMELLMVPLFLKWHCLLVFLSMSLRYMLLVMVVLSLFTCY